MIADFVIQNKTKALEIMKQWNPQWKPQYFKTRYSEAELLVIEKCFATTKVFLCDFHREQAWERWVKDRLSSYFSCLERVLIQQNVHKAVDQAQPSSELDTNSLEQPKSPSPYQLAVIDLKCLEDVRM